MHKVIGKGFRVGGESTRGRVVGEEGHRIFGTDIVVGGRAFPANQRQGVLLPSARSGQTKHGKARLGYGGKEGGRLVEQERTSKTSDDLVF